MNSKYLILISTIILILTACPPFQAQSTSTSASSSAAAGNNAPVNISGKVSNISAAESRLSILTADGKNIAVTFDKAVEFKRVPAGETTLRNAAGITLAEINAGDNAFVRGRLVSENNVLARQVIIVSQADIIKRQDQRREEWKTRGIAGIVKKIDPATRRISVQTKGANSQLIELAPTGSTTFQRYETNAGSLNDFKASSLEAIKEGDQIRAIGNKSADGLELVPEEIFSGSFRIVTGKVLSVNPAGGELTLADSQTGKTVTVVVNPESNLRHLTADSIKSETEKTSGENNKQNTASTARDNAAAAGSINLTSLLDKSPKINIADIKTGETIVVASLSDAGAERINGITVVSGVELLKAQAGNKSNSNTTRKFNLDVF